MHEEFTNILGTVGDKYTPDYSVGEKLIFRNSTPNTIRIVDNGNVALDAVKWDGLDQDEAWFRPGAVFDPEPIEGEDPNSGAFKYRYFVTKGGALKFEIR